MQLLVLISSELSRVLSRVLHANCFTVDQQLKIRSGEQMSAGAVMSGEHDATLGATTGCGIESCPPPLTLSFTHIHSNTYTQSFTRAHKSICIHAE